MAVLHFSQSLVARTMLHDRRGLASLVALLGLGVLTLLVAPITFWAGALHGWAADLAPRGAATLGQPLAVAYVAASAVCAVLAGVCFERARALRTCWLGVLLGLLPIEVLSLATGLGLASLAVIALGCTVWTLGHLALRRVRPDATTLVERLMLDLGVGLGISVFFALGVGLLGLLTAPTVLFEMLVVAALALALVWRRPRQSLAQAAATPVHLDRGVAVAIGGLILLLQVVAPFVVAPEITYDAVYYHLTIVSEFVRRGAVVELPNIFASTFPLLPHLAYTQAALLGGLDAAKLVHFGVGLASVAGVYALGRRVAGDARSGVLAAVFWAATPLVLWEMSTAYVDMFSALLTIGALISAMLWLDTRQARYALVCGVFAGLGLGVKPNMALVGAPLYAAVIVLEVRRRRDLARWIGSGVLASLVGAPWYLRAYLLTGNPVFPFLNGVFRSSQWAPVNDNFNFDSFGMGRSPADLLLLPWHLTFNTGRFSEVPDGALGVLPLALATAPVFIVLGRNRRTRLMATYVLIALAAWAVYAQYARYLLAALPAAAVLLGCLLGRLSRMRGQQAQLIGYGCAALIVLASVPIFLVSFWDVPQFIPWAVDLGQQSRTAYLEQALRHYSAYEWIGDNLPPGDSSRILGVGFGEWPIAYSPVPVYISHMTYVGQQILTASDGPSTLAKLEAGGFHYVLIDFFPRPAAWRSSYIIAQDDFINNHLKLIYANNYVYLYQVVESNAAASQTHVAATTDSTFASLSDGSTSVWQAFGPNLFKLNSSSCPGVQVARGSGILQTFSAVPNTLYTFGADMSSGSPKPGSGTLEVTWKRAAHPAPVIDIEVEGLATALQHFEISSTSPSDATQGTFYLSSFDDDNVCLRSGAGFLNKDSQ